MNENYAQPAMPGVEAGILSGDPAADRRPCKVAPTLLGSGTILREVCGGEDARGRLRIPRMCLGDELQ